MSEVGSVYDWALYHNTKHAIKDAQESSKRRECVVYVAKSYQQVVSHTLVTTHAGLAASHGLLIRMFDRGNEIELIKDDEQ